MTFPVDAPESVGTEIAVTPVVFFPEALPGDVSVPEVLDEFFFLVDPSESFGTQIAVTPVASFPEALSRDV